MKHVKFIGFVLLSLYLVILGFVGLFGVTAEFVPTLLNILAFVAGIFFLISLGTCCCTGDRCDVDKVDRDPRV